MNGGTVKYHKSPSESSGRVTIPNALAKALNWEHKDEISIIIKTLDGHTGLFLFKKED